MRLLLNEIKNIFCDDLPIDKKDSLFHLIDTNNLPSLIIVEPDGKFIKKEQVLDVQHLFSKSSQYTKEKVYIIKMAERMNKESANTILKFLEEPQDNVIAFFITNNKDSIFSTIQSRCQIINAMFENEEYEKININKEEYEKYSKIAKDYLNSIEVEKKELILYNNKYLIDLEREEIRIIMQIILNIYQNSLNNKVDEYCKYISDYSFKNKIAKIKLITEILYELTYNVNINLLLDKFVIEMEGINNEII